jgi:hypothetical protein
MKNRNRLEILFDIVLQKSYLLRSKNPYKFDGLAFWQPIKKILEPLDIYQAKKWKSISKSITEKIMSLPEYYIDAYENKKLIEQNHFIIQQVRIPNKENPTIKKIIQLALNIGQYKGTPCKDLFLSKDEYKKFKLNTLDRYISESDIIELSNYISDEILEEIEKYLKKFK